MKAAAAFLTSIIAILLLLSQFRVAGIPQGITDVADDLWRGVPQYLESCFSHNTLLAVSIVLAIISSIWLIYQVPAVKSR